MGKPLVVELNEKTYAALQQKAEKEGLSPANLVASSLERQFESIESDLAKEYGADHEQG